MYETIIAFFSFAFQISHEENDDKSPGLLRNTAALSHY